jgi:hypothetical protein
MFGRVKYNVVISTCKYDRCTDNYNNNNDNDDNDKFNNMQCTSAMTFEQKYK